MYELNGRRFEWDLAKNLSNIAKHGIPFKLAASVFSDPDSIELDDFKHSQDEERFITIGKCRNLDLLMVCHCYRQNETVIRIISAREANETETALYGGQ